MLTILSCDCGHRFEVPDTSGTHVPCPSCGQMLDMPEGPPVTLSMARLLPRHASPDAARGAVPHAYACPDCGGTGQCAACRGRGCELTGGFFRTFGIVVLYVFFGFWAVIIRNMFSVPNNLSSLGPGGCLNCNGRGICYRCKGTGQALA
jgi:hypothetical protein